MTDDLINQAAKLMQEQADAYARLNSACNQLTAVLVNGTPESIESLTRAGESELLRMRARLVQIMSTLTAFAEARARSSHAAPVMAEARARFEAASNKLSAAARDFQRTCKRAAALATNGSSLASTHIEMCGFRPTTYRAPYARYGEKLWA